MTGKAGIRILKPSYFREAESFLEVFCPEKPLAFAFVLGFSREPDLDLDLLLEPDWGSPSSFSFLSRALDLDSKHFIQ